MRNILIVFIAFFVWTGIASANDYHVMGNRDDGRSARVVFHIPIPVENNSASVALRTAVGEYIKPRLEDGTFGTFKSIYQGILTAEETQLQNGELYEHVNSVKFLALDTNAQKQTKIDNKFTALSTSVLTKIRARLKFWGLDRDVP